MNDTVAKVLGDSAELAGPAAKVIEEFRDDMTDLLNDLHNVTAEEEYREFGYRACDAQIKMYERLIHLAA